MSRSRGIFPAQLAVLLVAFDLAGVTPAAAAAAAREEPAAVLASDSAHYRQALDGFVEEWGSTVTVVGLAAPLPPTKAFAAFGSKAAARDWPSDAVVVACLAPSAAAVEGDPVTRVSLLPDPGVLLDRARALLPSLKSLRVFWSSEGSRADVEALAAAGRERDIEILAERIAEPAQLPERLRGLKGKADALWLMPDPALVSEENFAVLREYAVAEKLPFFAPTEGLSERGATATIAATFRDMGRAAAASLRARLAGRPEAEVVRPSRVVVTVNAASARATGLTFAFASADKVLR